MENILFTFNTVMPVFFLVILGLALKKLKIIKEDFVKVITNFVYNVSLPVLIFLKLYGVTLGKAFDIKLTLILVFGSIIIFVIGWFSSGIFSNNRMDRGVITQGSFRSNYAIVGLALILRMFGAEAVARASLPLVFVLPIYNLLSILVLRDNSNSSKIISFQDIKEILLNPLILSVVVALPFSIFSIKLYTPLHTTLDYLASIALPLALIGIGASINLEAIKKTSTHSILATFIKLIISPVLAVTAAYFLDVRGIDLGILFIIFGCPTAIASFILSLAMGGDRELSGNIVVLSTLFSIFTLTVGLSILRVLQLI